LRHNITPVINESICNQIQPNSSTLLLLLLNPTAELFYKALFMSIDTEDLAQIWWSMSKSDREAAVGNLSLFLDYKRQQNITEVN